MKNKKEILSTVKEYVSVDTNKKEYDRKSRELDVRKKELIRTIIQLFAGNSAIRLKGQLIKIGHVKQSRLNQAEAQKALHKNGIAIPMMDVEYDTVSIKEGAIGEDRVIEGPDAG